MSQELNLFRLKTFETDSLIYLNALYSDLNNALDSGSMPYSLVDSEILLEYYEVFIYILSANGYVTFRNFDEIAKNEVSPNNLRKRSFKPKFHLRNRKK